MKSGTNSDPPNGPTTGHGLVAQDSRKGGIALSVAGQSDLGAGDEEGELE